MGVASDVFSLGRDIDTWPSFLDFVGRINVTNSCGLHAVCFESCFAIDCLNLSSAVIE